MADLCQLKGYYFITDNSFYDILESARLALEAGATVIQYRHKDASTRQMAETSIKLRSLTDSRALLIINDRIDIALACGADGIHLGQADMPVELARKLFGGIIGITVHDVDEAVDAARSGADYIGLSPIFETSTKKDAGRACGTGMISDVKKAVDIPVIAIGGINHSNAKAVVDSGADGLCSISAVLGSGDIIGQIRKFQVLYEG